MLARDPLLPMATSSKGSSCTEIQLVRRAASLVPVPTLLSEWTPRLSKPSTRRHTLTHTTHTYTAHMHTHTRTTHTHTHTTHTHIYTHSHIHTHTQTTNILTYTIYSHTLTLTHIHTPHTYIHTTEAPKGEQNKRKKKICTFNSQNFLKFGETQL